jgi:hypothetical protein
MRILIFLLTLIVITGCKKEMPDPPTEVTSNTHGWGGGNYSQYDVTFFTSNFNFSQTISVNFNSGLGIITQVTSYNPGCGSTGSANFSVPSGTYTYSASGNGKFWSGTIVTGATQCITRVLN